jgi:hypothetical protein
MLFYWFTFFILCSCCGSTGGFKDAQSWAFSLLPAFSQCGQLLLGKRFVNCVPTGSALVYHQFDCDACRFSCKPRASTHHATQYQFTLTLKMIRNGGLFQGKFIECARTKRNLETPFRRKKLNLPHANLNTNSVS